jgi:hypothetical protein
MLTEASAAITRRLGRASDGSAPRAWRNPMLSTPGL